MPNTRELRRRIKSIKNTSQITKAMQMVAATKMRKAQNQAISGRPYTTTLHKAVMALLPKLSGELSHPLIMENNSNKASALVITTDKGLCGSLNTNIFKAITQFIANPSPSLQSKRPEAVIVKQDEHSSSLRAQRGNLVKQDPHGANAPQDDNKRGSDKVFYTIGKKGRSFIAKMGKDLVADFENSDLVTFRTASQIGRLVSKSFVAGEISSFSVIYPNFVSALRQEPRIMQLLPINLESLKEFYDLTLGDTPDAKRDEHHSSLRGENRRGNPVSEQDRHSGKPDRDDATSEEFLFEPNLSELLEFVLTHYVQVKIYQALLETKASEHSARMIAMQNATDNAKELVEDLTLSYNQTRQAGITNELLEITSAQAALE